MRRHSRPLLFPLLLISLFAGPASLTGGAWAKSTGTASPLLFGLSPTMATDDLLNRFTPLARFLEAELGRPVEVRIARSSLTQIVRLGVDRIDFAFMDAGEYVALSERYGPKPLLARLNFAEDRRERGMIVASSEGPIRQFADLEGVDFAFGDANSAIGFLIPHALLSEAGISVKGRHLPRLVNVAYGILSGNFAAGAVDETVYSRFAHHGLRLVAPLPETPPSVLVARGSMSKSLLREIRAALWRLNRTSEGKAVIAAIQPLATGLTGIEDDEFDGLRRMLAVTGGQ